MFQLAFPQPAMLSGADMQKILVAIRAGANKSVLQQLAEDIRIKMNPHPGNQKTENVPRLNGEEVPGMQHKYKETVLYFPSEASALGGKERRQTRRKKESNPFN